MVATVFVTEPANWIDVPFRVDDAVALKLAMLAHADGVTLNELMVAILTHMVSAHRVIRSRNAREGHYVGRWRGSHVRSTETWASYGRRDGRTAMAVKKQRLKKKLTKLLQEPNHD
jgi:hypothetical protein